MLLIAAQPGASRAAFDMTGDWHAAVEPGGFGLLHFVQTGTSLQFQIGSGTIAPDTGAFTLLFPFTPPDCGAVFDGQLDASGDTFTAAGAVYFTPVDCPSIGCVCSASQPATLRGSRSPCGNAVVDAGESCDDGTLGQNGSCCGLDCTPRPAGQGCFGDGNLCTSDVCDALGVCTHSALADGSDCSDGQFCNGEESSCQSGACQDGAAPCPLGCDEANDQCVAVCPSTPQACRAAEKSLLLVKNGGAKDKLVWKWIKGAPTSQAEFGDPTGSADYAFCIYAGAAPALIADSIVPAGAPTWKTIGTAGYKYDDPSAAADGIARVLLKGSAQNKSKALIKGRGAIVPLAALPVEAPLTMQLVNGGNGLCWGATFTDAQLRTNEAAQLRAKVP